MCRCLCDCNLLRFVSAIREEKRFSRLIRVRIKPCYNNSILLVLLRSTIHQRGVLFCCTLGELHTNLQRAYNINTTGMKKGSINVVLASSTAEQKSQTCQRAYLDSSWMAHVRNRPSKSTRWNVLVEHVRLKMRAPGWYLSWIIWFPFFDGL
jgi:hypothetical protein